jgi:hypothetical protein
MAMFESVETRKFVLLAAALALVLSVAGCAPGAAGSAPGPLASHGVDDIPAFDTPYSGGGRG